MILLAFVRIGTDPRVFTTPLDPADAIGIVRGWLERSNARLVHPTSSHFSALESTIDSGRARGPLITDAHIATLAKEHGAQVCTAHRASPASTMSTPSIPRGDRWRFPGPTVAPLTSISRS